MVKQVVLRLSSENHLVVWRVGKSHHYWSFLDYSREWQDTSCSMFQQVTPGAKPEFRGPEWNRIPLESLMLNLPKAHGE